MKLSIPLFFVLADFATVLAAPFGGEFARGVAAIDITTRDAKDNNVFARQPFGGEFARDAKDDNVFARQPFGGEFARDEANVFARDAKEDNVFARQPIGEFARK
jgi:hypothetical protein